VAAATARLAGSTKFGRPQKRKRFWGARTSPTRGALDESPLKSSVFYSLKT